MGQASKKSRVLDGRYEILSIVGRGAFSVVYHARYLKPPHSEIAIKVLVDRKGQPSSRDHLRKEALAMVSSRHRYVVRLDDFHTVENLSYLCMEYAPEADLRTYCNKHGSRITPLQAQRYLLQLGEALDFMHQSGILHRDLKPDNILVVNEREVRVGDFGMALLPGETTSLEDLHKGVGTMDYMAPEVIEGVTCDELSDIYAIGVTFYEVLTGRHPFADKPLAQILEARRDKNVPPLSQAAIDVPESLAAIVMKAMAYDRSTRFQTAKELVEAVFEQRSRTQKSAAAKPAGTFKRKPLSKAIAADKSLEKKTVAEVAKLLSSVPAEFGAVSGAHELATTEPIEAAPAPKHENKVSAAASAGSDTTGAQNIPGGESAADVRSEADAITAKLAAIEAEMAAHPVQSAEGSPHSMPVDSADETSAEALKTQMESTGADETKPTEPERTPTIETEAPDENAAAKDGPEHGAEAPRPPEGSATNTQLSDLAPYVEAAPQDASRAHPLDSARELAAAGSGNADIRIEVQPGATQDASNSVTQSAAPSGRARSRKKKPSASLDNIVRHLVDTDDVAQSSYFNPFAQKNSMDRESSSKKPGATQSGSAPQQLQNQDTSSTIEIRFQPNGKAQHQFEMAQRLKNPLVRWIMSAVIILLIADLAYNHATKRHLTDLAKRLVVSTEPALIEPVTSQALAFPTLPAGMYSGTISGLYGSKTFPLAIISMPDRRELTFLIGIEGWSPVALSLDDANTVRSDADGKPELRLAAEGIVLQLTGALQNDQISGLVMNRVTKEKGTWQVTPVRK